MKVFSSYDDYGYEDERLYSVLMNEEELALFSDMKEEEEKKKKGMSKGAKVALGVGGATAATGAAGIYGANKVGKVLINKAGKIANDNARLVNMAKTGTLGKREQEAADKLIKEINRNTIIGELLQKPANNISKAVGKVIKRKVTKR